MGSIVNAGPPYSEATLRRMYNFVSNNVWELKRFSTVHTQFGIDNEDRARTDYKNPWRLTILDSHVQRQDFG